MKTVHDFEYKGQKARVGGLYFDEKDRMYVFVTYCPDCHGKVVMSRDEAGYFSLRYKAEQNKTRTRKLIKLVDRVKIKKQPLRSSCGAAYEDNREKMWKSQGNYESAY